MNKRFLALFVVLVTGLSLIYFPAFSLERRTDGRKEQEPRQEQRKEQESRKGIKETTQARRPAISSDSNIVINQETRRGEVRFGSGKEQRTVEIRMARGVEAAIEDDQRIVVRKDNKEYRIELRMKELILSRVRQKETLRNVFLEVDNDRPVYVLEKTRPVKILGIFPAQQKIKEIIDAGNLKLVKEQKPWWFIFSKEDWANPQPGGPLYKCGDGICQNKYYSSIPAIMCPFDNEYCEYSKTCPADCAPVCGNGKCEPGETGVKEHVEEEDFLIWCAYDCGYAGDGVCGAGEFLSTDDHYESWAIDCPPACGNGKCDPGESPEICPYECGATACGNGKCEWNESPYICAEDCGTPCGNGICEPGEGLSECPVDCGPCMDGICQGKEFNEGYCPQDCAAAGAEPKTICQKNLINCGNGACDGAETAKICPQDCLNAAEPKYDLSQYQNNPAVPDCGNKICGPWETVANCPLDCPPPVCGNGVCDATENPVKCASDCANVCGNNICDKGETYLACPCDCSWCGDGVCGANEEKCQLDCIP